MKTRPIIFLSLLLSLSMFGCSRQQRPEGMPKLHPTVITLTQEDKPLEGAIVVLHPQDEVLKRWGSGGKTDSNGKTNLLTLGKYQGVPAGFYKITVSKIENEPIPPGLAPEKLEAFELRRKAYWLVNPQYSDTSQTPFEIEIKTGLNEKTFELGKAIHQEIK